MLALEREMVIGAFILVGIGVIILIKALFFREG